jgi:hypothetical protein
LVGEKSELGIKIETLNTTLNEKEKEIKEKESALQKVLLNF